jgi:hypothetical protein
MKGFYRYVHWVLVLLCVISTSAQAVGDGSGTVSLRAVTAAGAPLMRPVSWKIYEVKEGNRSLTTAFSRHAGVLNLHQGNYIAELLFSGIRYEQPFTLKAQHDVDVTISIKSETRVF